MFLFWISEVRPAKWQLILLQVKVFWYCFYLYFVGIIKDLWFQGVNFHSEDLLRDPAPVKRARELGLVCFVWGDDLDDRENVEYMKKLGLDGVIYDRLGFWLLINSIISYITLGLVKLKHVKIFLSLKEMQKIRCFHPPRIHPVMVLWIRSPCHPPIRFHIHWIT